MRNAHARLQELESNQSESGTPRDHKFSETDNSLLCQSLIDNVSDPIFVQDHQGALIKCNQAFARLFGLHRDTLKGKRFADFLPDDLSEELQKQASQVVQNGKARTHTFWYHDHKGTSFLLETVFTPLTLPDGSRPGLVGISKDITRHQELESSQRPSEQLLAATLNSVDGLLNVLSPDFQIIYSNWKEHEFVPDAQRDKQPFCYQAFQHRKEPCDKCPVLRTFKDGQIRRVESTNAVTGAHKEVTVTPIWGPSGEIAYVVEFVRDITEKKKNQEALEKQEQLYRQLFNSANDAIYLFILGEDNQAGCFIQVNDVACKLLGYSREELLQMSIFDIDVKGKALLASEKFEPFFQSHHLLHEEYHVAKDGTPIPVEINTRLFELDNIKYVISIARDIRERKMAEQLLRQSEERARAILAVIPDTLLVVHRQGQVLELFQNDSSRIFSEALVPHSIGDIFVKTTAHSLLKSIGETLDHDSMQIFEFRMPLQHGDHKQFEARIVKRSEDSALLMVRDISALRDTEAALYEANQRLRLVMRFANEGKWECDFIANVYRFDEQAALMLGYTPDQAQWPPEEWQDRIHPEHLEQVTEALDDTLSQKSRYFSQEYRMRHKDGSYIWVASVGGVVRRDEEHRPRLFMGINRNITERKLAEQRLRESEEKYRMLVTNIRDAIYTLDENMQATYISPLAADLTGYTLEELYSMSPEECIHPQSRERYRRDMQKQLENDAKTTVARASKYFEVECLRKDGSTIMVESSTSILRADDGSFKGFIGIVRDISERKRMEKKLRESEERYRSLFENAGDAIYVLNAQENTFLDANPITWLSLGYTREELLQLEPRKLNPELYQCNPLENRICRAFECEHITKNGIRVPVEISSQHIAFGEQEAILYIARDISERRKAQQALEESEKRFRLLFNSTPVALLVEDYSQTKLVLDKLRSQGVTDFEAYFNENPQVVRSLAETVILTEVNPYTIHLFEDDPDRTTERYMTEVFNEQSYKSFGETLILAAQGKTSFSHIRVHQTKKGKLLDTKFTWTVVPGHETTWDQVFVSAVDVTELTEARRQADQANKAKSQFLSSMSHDIRTPLSGIMGMLQLLEQGPLNTRQETYAKSARQACIHLNRLLADILSLSKLEAGKLSIANEPFRVQKVLDSLMDLFSFTAEQAGLRFTVDPAPDIPMIRGDESNLLRILTNLVGNALKFTSKGEISVNVTLLRRVKNNGELNLLFSVSDTGMGIPDDKIEKMFQPYAQGDYVAPQQGVGLGLSIVKQLVQLMHGGITVISELNKGSTFNVDIPFAIAEEFLEAEFVAPGKSSCASNRIHRSSGGG